MASDASINKRKNSGNTGDRDPFFSLFLGLIGLQWLLILIVSFFLWGLAAIRAGQYLLSGEITPITFSGISIGESSYGTFSLFNFGDSVLTGSVDPLITIVVIIIVVALLIPIIFSSWVLASVVDAWRMRISGYQNLLTVAVGQVLIVAIIIVNIPVTVAALVWMGLLLVLGHFKFYPEYRGMALSDLLRDLRFIRVISQVFFVAIIFFVMKFLVINVYDSLLSNNLVPSFEFLFRRAGFDINQSPDWYSGDSRYGDAFIVAVTNTLQVVSVGLVLATVMGVLLGIFLLSQNWLVRTLSRVYVEILRNTPLLVQLVFWYFVVWLGLPNTNLSFPDESVMVIQLRYFPYLFALIGAIIYVWRMNPPGRLFNGFLTGFVIAELAFWLLGDNYVVIIALGIVGALTIVATHRGDIVPKSYEGLAMGAGAMLLVQLAGHLMLDILGAVNIIENARVVYGEVVPILVIGPNLTATPNFALTPNFNLFAMIAGAGIVIAVVLYIYWGTIIDRSGADIPRTVYAIGIIVIVAVIGWFVASRPIPEDLQITIGEGEALQTLPLSQVREEGLLDEEQLVIYDTEQPFVVQPPELNRFGRRVMVGNNISPNHMALLIGLVVYTSAFIGEIVRAGIQAVPWGQVEAARALGLSTAQTLRMIILPQALRVIIPPMGNQYLNLSKNSSLATAIAFADTYQVGTTIMNQSGQSISGFAIILVVYLSLSLIISLVMNLVNSRFQLVTR